MPPNVKRKDLTMTDRTTPWWRIRMLWLVIGGPLAVVMASVATLLIALSHPDPLVSDTAGMGAAKSSSLTPAIQARNHAAAAQPLR